MVPMDLAPGCFSLWDAGQVGVAHVAVQVRHFLFCTHTKEAAPQNHTLSLGWEGGGTQHTIWNKSKVQDPVFLPQTSGRGEGM